MENQPKADKPKNAKKDKIVDLAKKYCRKECESLLIRKFFFTQAFEIYGGVAGLYDFGPLGSSLKGNIEQEWKKHFILEEDMLEMTCTNMTLSNVLKTSGHVDKFADFMVKDVKNGQCHRADKLIDDAIGKILAKDKKLSPEQKEKLQRIQQDCENYLAEELDACIAENKFKAPETGNDLGPAQAFNLMFSSEIGPTGQLQGYLRPETAQGIFLNFRRLLEFNNGKMPFAGAQLGLGFRNEIRPQQGLLRVREFQMAEIEHFVDPMNKKHHKFVNIANECLPLLTAPNQEAAGDMIYDMTMGDAVSSGTIANETIGYFMARTYQFFIKIGIRKDAIRFRQHRCNEMAHYADDCWDAEVETSYGWIEVAGHSDRSCFDLSRHAKETNTEMVAARPLKEPKIVKFIQLTLDKQKIGKTYKKDSKAICAFLDGLDEEQKETYLKDMEDKKSIKFPLNGADFELPSEFVKFEAKEKKVLEEKYIPSVIEPSYGIGRIVYCVFEHCFKMREADAQRTYFDFPAIIAPIKCTILPLMSQPALNEQVQKLRRILLDSGLSSKVDDSGQTVGKRYARTDEMGVPYAFTIDFDTLENQTITMRELDSMKQVRLPMQEAPAVLHKLINGVATWAQMMEHYGEVENKKE